MRDEPGNSGAAQSPGPEPAVGIDSGATLIKLAIRTRDGELRYELHPSDARTQVTQVVSSLAPAAVGLTGGGASALAREMRAGTVAAVNEFEAWSIGASTLLRESGQTNQERFLLVSLGTGTSVLLLDGDRALRVGGTALGGGTVLGLGAALAGDARFEALCALAARGRRETVDLRVADIYPAEDAPLPGEVTAASFAKLAAGSQPAPADMAAGIMGLVGENVALICCGLAAASDVQDIVYAGTTVRNNPALVAVLRLATLAMGRRPVFLPKGEYAGALGALLVAERAQ